MYTKKTDFSIFGIQVIRYYKNNVEIARKQGANNKIYFLKTQPNIFLNENAIYRILRKHNSVILQECIINSGYLELIDGMGFIPIEYCKYIDKKIPYVFTIN